MRQSAHTSALALQQCIMQSHPGVHEQQIAASFGELVVYPCTRQHYVCQQPLVYGGPAVSLIKESVSASMCLVSQHISQRALNVCPPAAEYSCKAAGADRMAYPPVVAGGTDACTIHYGRNDKVWARHVCAQ